MLIEPINVDQNAAIDFMLHLVHVSNRDAFVCAALHAEVQPLLAPLQQTFADIFRS